MIIEHQIAVEFKFRNESKVGQIRLLPRIGEKVQFLNNPEYFNGMFYVKDIIHNYNSAVLSPIEIILETDDV